MTVEMLKNGYKLTFEPKDSKFQDSILDQLGKIEALSQPGGEPIRADLIIFEAKEIIRLARAYKKNLRR